MPKFIDKISYLDTTGVEVDLNQIQGVATVDASTLSVANAKEAQEAQHAVNADHATNADNATKATQDGSGRVIEDTYYRAGFLPNVFLGTTKCTNAAAVCKVLDSCFPNIPILPGFVSCNSFLLRAAIEIETLLGGSSSTLYTTAICKGIPYEYCLFLPNYIPNPTNGPEFGIGFYILPLSSSKTDGFAPMEGSFLSVKNTSDSMPLSSFTVKSVSIERILFQSALE